MKEVKLVPYEPAHAYEILNRNVREQDIWLSDFPQWEEWARGWAEYGKGWTLIIDGNVIGAAGIVMMEWNKGEAWALLSTLFYKYPKTAYKSLKWGLDKIISEDNLKRVQSLILCNAPNIEACKRLLEHLGFTCETPNGMPGYGPNGERVLLYGREC